MAGEIAHVIYGARIVTHLGDLVSHPSYWIGTLFPDIYRIERTSRFPTHPRSVRLSTLVGNNDFITGMRVHSWIDETREAFFREHRVFEQLPWHPLLGLALELLEDELLYSSYTDWNLIIRILATVHPDEERIIHSRLHIQAWHALLTQYCKNAPSDESRIAFMRAMEISQHTAEEVNKVISELRTNQTAKKILNDLLQSFEHILL